MTIYEIVPGFDPDHHPPRTDERTFSRIRALFSPAVRTLICCKELREEVAEQCRDALGYEPAYDDNTHRITLRSDADCVWFALLASSLLNTSGHSNWPP